MREVHPQRRVAIGRDEHRRVAVGVLHEKSTHQIVLVSQAGLLDPVREEQQLRGLDAARRQNEQFRRDREPMAFRAGHVHSLDSPSRVRGS